MRPLVYYTLLRLGAALPSAGQQALPEVQHQVKALADNLMVGWPAHPYDTVRGQRASDFN